MSSRRLAGTFQSQVNLSSGTRFRVLLRGQRKSTWAHVTGSCEWVEAHECKGICLHRPRQWREQTGPRMPGRICGCSQRVSDRLSQKRKSDQWVERPEQTSQNLHFCNLQWGTGQDPNCSDPNQHPLRRFNDIRGPTTNPSWQ